MEREFLRNFQSAFVEVHTLTGSAVDSARAPFDPELVGDHPALDLMNTVMRLEGGLVDVWQNDDDVLRWLLRTGLRETKAAPQFRRGALLSAARGLREVVRALVVARKENKRLQITLLNDFLTHGTSHETLTRGTGGSLAVTRQYDQRTPEGSLAPLAEAAAAFLATTNFDLVRACEGVDCVLWFYDRTKAHRRRWCSMAICGNRAKIVRFRSRQEA